MDKKDSNEIQELLLALIPLWNYKVTKPLKKSLEAGVSMEMYHCIQIIRANSGCMNMSELAKRINMSKQQATKLIDKLVEHDLVKRVYDDTDRRVIKIQETQRSKGYIDYFLREKVDCFDDLLLHMSEAEKSKLKKALKDLYTIFTRDMTK